MSQLLQNKLAELVETHLHRHPIWQGQFFQTLDDTSQDPKRVWQMLFNWVENMQAASYGFQTYVLTLAARATVEPVRRLLLENAFEELGDIEYPTRSHFQMVCKLARLCGVPEEHIGHNPRLLATSAKHVETHIERCRNAPFLYGLGMIFLIENLTRLEFERVLIGFIRWWEKGSEQPLTKFAVENGVAYFTSNMEADDGHAEDVAKMIETTFSSMGVDFDNPAALEPHINALGAGMAESIDLRTGFMQGVYESAFRV